MSLRSIKLKVIIKVLKCRAFLTPKYSIFTIRSQFTLQKQKQKQKYQFLQDCVSLEPAYFEIIQHILMPTS